MQPLSLTWQVDVGKIDGHYATVKGGHMEATYNLQQLQFHWGTNDTTGTMLHGSF